MAEHLHTQIAQAASSIVGGSDVPSINGRSFPFRVYPAKVEDLPYASVWVPSDDVQRESGDGGAETLVEAVAEVLVAVFVQGDERDIESLLNASMLEVQAALAAGLALDSGHVDLDYAGCTKSYEGADLPYGQALLRFAAEIAYDKGDPTRLAWK